MSGKIVGAIDLGGTKILSAIVDRRGVVLATDRRHTVSDGPQAVVADMAGSLRSACKTAGVTVESLLGVGVSAAGPIDAATGVIAKAPNLPGWHDVPLTSLLREHLQMPILLDNDANAAAVAEHTFGAGRGCTQMIYITISTGIGGGIITDGHLYRGATGAAGEIGHVVLVPDGPLCGCGQRGCLEALASGTAIAREARTAAAAGSSSALQQFASAGGEITAEAVATAAKGGDPAAAKIIADAARWLGMGLVVLVHLFNPERIIIGGGASNIGEPLLGPAEAYMRRHAFTTMSAAVQVLPAKYADEAGVIGAAALAFQHADTHA